MLAVVHVLHKCFQTVPPRKEVFDTHQSCCSPVNTKDFGTHRATGEGCEILQEFQYEIEHHAGRLHTNADTMSRRPCKQCGHPNYDEIGADRFDDEVGLIRSATVFLRKNEWVT